jgi:hypothetical protein
MAISGADIAIPDATVRVAAALAVGSDRLAESAAALAAASLNMGEWSEAGVASEIMFNAVELHLMGRAGEAASLANLALDLAAGNIARPPNSRGESTVTSLDFESAGCVRILGAMIFRPPGGCREGPLRARVRSRRPSAVLPAKEATPRFRASSRAVRPGWFFGDADRATKAISSASTTYGNMKLNNPAELVAADAIVGTLLRRAGQGDAGNKAIDTALQTCDQAARCGTPNVAWAVTLAAWERRAAKDPAANDLAQRAMDIWEQDTDVLVRGLQEHERRAVDRGRRVAADLLLDLERKDSRSVLESMLKSEAASRDAEVDDPASLWQSISALPELVAAADKVRDLRAKLARFAVAAFDPAQGEIRRFRTDQQAHEVEAAESALAALDPKFSSNQTVSGASLDDICKGMPAGSVLVHVRRADARHAWLRRSRSHRWHLHRPAGSISVPCRRVDGDVGAYRNAAIARDANAFAAASKQVASPDLDAGRDQGRRGEDRVRRSRRTDRRRVVRHAARLERLPRRPPRVRLPGRARGFAPLEGRRARGGHAAGLRRHRSRARSRAREPPDDDPDHARCAIVPRLRDRCRERIAVGGRARGRGCDRAQARRGARRSCSRRRSPTAPTDARVCSKGARVASARRCSTGRSDRADTAPSASRSAATARAFSASAATRTASGPQRRSRRRICARHGRWSSPAGRCGRSGRARAMYGGVRGAARATSCSRSGPSAPRAGSQPLAPPPRRGVAPSGADRRSEEVGRSPWEWGAWVIGGDWR